MKKINLPFLSPKAFKLHAQSLLKHIRPSLEKVGSIPGTLVYTGDEITPTRIKLFQYDKSSLSFEDIENLEQLNDKLSKNHINWVDVTGFQNIELLGEMGELFGIDKLTMEDLVNVNQLPKVDEHDNYLHVTLKMIDLDEENNNISFTHYSLIVKGNLLITFSEKPSELLSNIEERLKNNFSKMRNSSTGYLSYRIIDTIVDYYYYTLDWFTNLLSHLEVELVENPSKHHINTILGFKKQWLVLRKAFSPLKEAVRKLLNLEPAFVKDAGKHYISDLYDHLLSIGETMEIIRETLNNLMDLYNSTVSNKMNEVMKVLTIVSTIFIPLTFIAGIYGMNFSNMPELLWENGYFYTLGFMVLIGVAMTIFVMRKRWL